MVSDTLLKLFQPFSTIIFLNTTELSVLFNCVPIHGSSFLHLFKQISVSILIVLTDKASLHL